VSSTFYASLLTHILCAHVILEQEIYLYLYMCNNFNMSFINNFTLLLCITSIVLILIPIVVHIDMIHFFFMSCFCL